MGSLKRMDSSHKYFFLNKYDNKMKNGKIQQVCLFSLVLSQNSLQNFLMKCLRHTLVKISQKYGIRAPISTSFYMIFRRQTLRALNLTPPPCSFWKSVLQLCAPHFKWTANTAWRKGVWGKKWEVDNSTLNLVCDVTIHTEWHIFRLQTPKAK